MATSLDAQFVLRHVRHPSRARLARAAGALVLAAATFGALLVPPASGAPIDDKKKQAAALEAEIEANAVQLAALYEQIKAADDQLGQANQTIADTQGHITVAEDAAHQLEALVRERAASVYRSSSDGSDGGIFTTDVGSLSSREQYASAASARDSHLLGQLGAARADLRAAQRDAQHAKQAAEDEKARLDAVKSQYEASQAERQRLLAQVKGELVTLVAQAEAARRAAETPKFDPSTVPPASGAGGVAVAFAESQLGKPYCEGGAGPDCYDCSGLTMTSWSHAGVSMSHNSESQYGSFPHVPMDQLAPGDIVWRPGHVGLYVGGGTVIHAPHTGDVVRYIGVGYFEGAARP